MYVARDIAYKEVCLKCLYLTDSHSSRMPVDSGCLSQFCILLGIFGKAYILCIARTVRLWCQHICMLWAQVRKLLPRMFLKKQKCETDVFKIFHPRYHQNPEFLIWQLKLQIRTFLVVRTVFIKVQSFEGS